MSKEKNLVKIKKSKNANTIFGLPAKSYIDENFWKKECETVLSNNWLAAPLLLVGALTFVTFAPSFFEGGFSALPVLIYNYAGRPQEEFQILAAAGVLLMLAVLIVINSFAIWLRARYEKSW